MSAEPWISGEWLGRIIRRSASRFCDPAGRFSVWLWPDMVPYALADILL
jgi:hypothetical protein